MKPLRPGPFRGDLVGQSPPQTDASTGEVTRAPLYVTAPWKQWPAPDIFPNIAALIVLSSPVPHPSPEPTFYKRAVPQIDLAPNIAVQTAPPAYSPRSYVDPLVRRTVVRVDQFPNLAVAGTEAAQMMLPGTDGQIFPRHPPDIDLAPNLAVRTGTVYVPPAPVEILPARRIGSLPDLSPNVAVRVVASAYSAPPLDWQPVRKWALPPDVFPNIAVRFVVEPVPLPASLDWQPSRKARLSPDLYPNVAVRIASPVYVPPAQLDVAITRKGTQPDLYPNLAVQFAVPFLPTALDVPTFHRTPPQIDLYPNLAVGVQGYVPPGSPEPLLRRSLTAVELYPNLAVLAPVAPTPLLIAVDPWINKRFAPQVEVFQNQAVYAPAESVPALQNELVQQTDLAKARITVAPDVFPNLAVEQDVTPVPPVIIPTTGTNDNNPRSAEGEYRLKNRRRKQKIPELPQPVFISPASFEHVPPQAVIDLVPDFTSLAQTLGAEPAALSRAIDVEIARLMAEQAERDDEEALMLILSALDD